MKKINFLNLKKINNKLIISNLNKIKNNLLSGMYTNSKEVFNFESNYKSFEKFNYCLGVNSGTSALHLAIESLKLKKNSYILVPSHTFLATIAAIEYSGNKPLFIDIDKDTFNLDFNILKKKKFKSIKAIIAVDMHGKECEIEKIYKICKKNNIPLIQDSSQSHGIKNSLKNPKSKFIKCQSFYPTKNLGGISEGGCILTNDQTLYNNIKSMRDWGRANGVMKTKGFNYRMTEMSALFLNIKLKYLKDLNKKKIKLANMYIKNLGQLIKEKYIKIQSPNNNVYHHFIIRVNKKLRDKLQIYLKKNNIDTMRHYKIPCHKERFFKNKFKLQNIKLKETEKLYNEMISLPCDSSTTLREIKIITTKIKKFYSNHAN